MTYTQAQIDKANAVDLEKFLRAQGETLVRSGKEYRWKAHDSLTVCGNKWFRHSQSKGGFPVDFVMEFYGKSFPEAVQMLTGEPGEAQPEADPAPSPAFRLPLRNVTNANILNYLAQEWKLSPSLVNFFIAAGDIYEDAAHHNVVFVGRDSDGHPRYASSRGIREKFRQDAAGAEKAFGFAHRGTDKQLLVFEAPIDLLSFIELFPKNWQQHNYLSLGGVSGKALRQFLSERPDVERVFLCLDADKAGEDACKRLAALLPDTVSVTRIQPCMKDWNDVLVHRAEIPNRNYFKSIVLKEPSKPETVKIIRMSDVELTPVEWLWKPYLPFGKLSVLQGNPGEGKTYFAMHLAAACTNGKLLPNMERMEPFNVIYQTAEDGLGDTVKPRLIEAGADLDRVLVIDDSDVQLTLSDERIEKAIMENIPMDTQVLQKWLKCGFVDTKQLFPTEEGTPQGGTISPTLMNMTLDGLERLLKERLPTRQHFNGKTHFNKMNFVRYADDFIVTGESPEFLREEVLPIIREFMAERGLQLSEEKTVITHIEDGFDFLGKNIRKYNGKLLIKPSKQSVSSLLKKVREIVKSNKSAKQDSLIRQLNPIIRGWVNNQRFVVSAEAFSKIDYQIYNCLWQWAKRRHKKKSRRWIAKKYWHCIGSRNWTFAAEERSKKRNKELSYFALEYATDTKIIRFKKIVAEANPFDARWNGYYEERDGEKMLNSTNGREKLLKVCPMLI